MSDKRAVWAGRIEAWRESGESAAGFCRSHGLVYAQFVYWQRVLRGAPAARSMIPVAVQASPSVSSAALELELPNGVRVRVPAGFPMTDAVALVRGLAC